MRMSPNIHEIKAPSDGSVLGEIENLSVNDIPNIVSKARKAFKTWCFSAPHERAQILRTAAKKLMLKQNELEILHAKESGKILIQSRKEISGAVELLEANAHIGQFKSGNLAPTGAFPNGERDLTIIERVPLGVVVCVIPFNFPVELTFEKAAAAIVAGNVVLLKPPPQNPLATMMAAQILNESGLPDGVLQILPGCNKFSAALCAESGIDAVSLTGSVQAGISLAKASAKLLRPLHLELGGNGVALILEDVDLKYVVSETLRGRLLMNGQACAGTKRIVVKENIADDFTELLNDALSKIKMGNPELPESQLGPLINHESASRVASQVECIVKQGGKLLRGNKYNGSAWFSPTILENVPKDADVAKDDEIFGPVFPIIRVQNDQEAIEVANQSSLKLTAAVFSSDLEHAFELAHKLDFGGIVINGTNNYRPPVVPFGGVGLAGTGREGLGYTYDELTRSRFIAVRNLRPSSKHILKGL